MERFFRFSDYDIWAYLSAGLMLIAASDFAFGTSWVLGAKWSAADGVMVIFAAYIIGQIAATPSSWLLERIIVAKVLGSPATNLFSDTQVGLRWLLKRTVLSDYYRPLDADLRKKITECAGSDTPPGEPIFWRAYAVAKRDGTAAPRMAAFLNLYGFCRNIAFVALVACCFNVAAIKGYSPTSALPRDESELRIWAFASAIAGLLMFHRFLKFYRLYAVEVFVSFAEIERRDEG